MSEITEEEIARVVRQAMLSNPDGGPFRHRESERSLIASEAARQILALLQPALERARREERERAGAIAAEWAKPQTMKLHAGEMTAGEVRTTSAVLRGLAAAIRKGSGE